jgi:hypothetical protein
MEGIEMKTQNYRLAKWFLDLYEMERKIYSEMLPLSTQLDVEDDELVKAMEDLAFAAGEHLKKYKLQATGK